MRFKKGTKVEVLSKAGGPCGSWLCGEIVNGNGHNYTIRYDGYQDAAGEKILERVSRKAMRPCPPALELAENWSPGDVVEFFQNFCWTMATVLKVLGKKHILVRLLGSSLRFQVSKPDIRVRQSWQDDKWIVVGKGSASCENENCDNTLISRQDLIASAQLQKTAIKMKQSVSSYYHPEKKEWNILESYSFSSKRLKRGSHSQIETYVEPPTKFRAIENEGRSQKASVASNSITSMNSNKLEFPIYAGPLEDVDSLVSDAKSVCQRGYPVSDAESVSQRGYPVSDAESVSQRGYPVSDAESVSQRGYPVSDAESVSQRGYPVSDAESLSQRGYPVSDAESVC